MPGAALMGNYQHKHNNIYCLCGCGERLGKGQQKYKNLKCNRKYLNKLARIERGVKKVARKKKKALLTPEQRSAKGKVKKTYIPKPKKLGDMNRGTSEGLKKYLELRPIYAADLLKGKTIEQFVGGMFR